MSQGEVPGRWERALRFSLRGSSHGEESVTQRIESLLIREEEEASQAEVSALRALLHSKGIRGDYYENLVEGGL